MPTKPKHYAVFILNENGSGTVKQFDTWQEAKAAYAAESVVNKAVYLYPQPMKAIGAGTTPIEAPAKTPVTFNTQQNTGQFTWPPTPPGPRPEYPGNPFSPDPNFEAWMTYCKANPTHRECTIPGNEKFGTESLVCQAPDGGTERSSDGTMYPHSYPKYVKADGLGGYFASTNEWEPDNSAVNFALWQTPCQYPDGFREYQDVNLTSTSKQLIFGTMFGTMVMSIERTALMRGSQKLMQYSGGVANLVRIENGVVPRDVQPSERALEVNALREYEAGEPVFNFNYTPAAMGVFVIFPLKPENEDSDPIDSVTEPVEIVVTETGNTHNIGTRTADIFRSTIATPSPNGPLNLNYDVEAGTGTGHWDVTMASPTELSFTFTPSGDTPADARPPEGWAGTVALDASGEPEGVDTTGVPPGGTHQGPWDYTYTPADTLLESDDENEYYTNGTGGYYAEPIDDDHGCDPAAEISRGPTQDYMYETPCGSHQLGYYNVVLYADGNCFTYEANDYDITSVGDFTTCEGTIYSVDAEGVVTTRPDCEDSALHVDGQDGWTYDGCHWSYDDGCDDEGTNLGTDPNDSCNDVYADGNCGTYTNSNGSCDDPDCEDSSAHTDGQEGWSYDGCNWSYDDRWNCEDEALHGGEAGWSYDGCNWSYCDPSGTDLGVDPSDSCQNIYADGICGTYTSSNSTCPECEDSALHTDGSEGWSYDGCNWSYDDNWNCDGAGTNLGGSGDPCYDLYADGNCGTYTSSNGSCDGDGGGGGGGGGCDSAGMMVSNGLTADLYITTPCGEVAAGTRTYDVYTDGNCGTTESTTNEAWASNGTELNSCSSNNENCTYYADGNGSYTSNCSPIEPPPEECESDSLHVEGEDGWTYDGCHWQQTECNGDPSTDVPDSESTGEEQGVGAGEAQLYDNDGNPVQYESYDPSTGEASFGAGNNPYQNGDWLRNSYGNIIYSSRSPRMATASIAPNWSNNLSCINNGTRTPSGKQSIQIQVGWRYTGRKRWRSDFNQFQNETVFANSADQPVSTKVAELAIIPAGTWVGIIPQAGAGPHTFYAFNGSATMPNGATGQKAYSDGVGGAYYGT